MAKKAKEKQEKSIEVSLWESANKLRGSVEPSEYKHVVLGLIFLKFVSDKFEEHRAKLIADGKEKYAEIPEFYNMSNVFFLEEISRWNYIKEKAKQDDLALIIDTALHTIEKDNKSLKGALPDNYFSLEDIYQRLARYVLDGRYRIDNNLAENAVGPMALGRKNYLFCLNHQAAERTAMIYSLLGTCKICGVNPSIWLTDVLNRIQDHSILKLDELLPHKWEPVK
ncbi:type I restriction-modification system subunit M N-terminal domain-containing protein [Viscerimonas tarda]